MNNYQKNNELDNYEAEIVEDIPEQFDVSRYRKQKSSDYRVTSNSTTNVIVKPIPRYKNADPQQQAPPQPQQPQQQHQDNRYAYGYEGNGEMHVNRNSSALYPDQKYTMQTNLSQPNMLMYQPQPRAVLYPRQINMAVGLTQSPLHQQLHPQYQNSTYMTTGMNAMYAVKQQPYPPNSAIFNSQENDDYSAPRKPHKYASDGKIVETNPPSKQQDQQRDLESDLRYSSSSHHSRRKAKTEQEKSRSSSLSSLHNVDHRRDHKSPDFYKDDRKPQFDEPTHMDSDNESTPGDLDPSSQQRLSNNQFKSDSNFRLSYYNTPVSVERDSNSQQSPQLTTLKSNLKSSIKKPGVKFDEKLEVFEINNPHYGQEIKSEKRELKKKKKDKRKEEEIIMKTKFDMKAKIQAKKSQLFYYYENSLLFNALSYYEDIYYRNSTIRSQEKVRDKFLQSIERDNQNVIEIINSIKTEYMSKLQQFCVQYQCQPEHLHTYPGMMQTIHNVANSINYTEIVGLYTSKDNDSGTSTLSKILGGGHDSKNEKIQMSNIQTSLKTPLKRKADIMPPKHVILAIDLHVQDVAKSNCKSITETIFKLKEICETDLHVVRTIFKYILHTQLKELREIATCKIIMSNLDSGIESANTIFSRLCSYAGVENKCIRGLWKNIRCEPSEKTELKCLWNVVNLTTAGWRFIQPAFTPVKVYSSNSEPGYEETEFYFLTDPDALFYEFLPMDKTWLFGDNAISVKDFDKRPIITPCFRTLNLAIINQASNIITNIEKEPFKLAIKYPHESADLINFKYKLKLASTVQNSKHVSSLAAEQNGELLFNQYVISEIISNEDAVMFKISSLPEVGVFTFTVYAEIADDLAQVAMPVSGVLTSNENMKAITSFKLTCSKMVHFETPPNHIHDIHLFGMNNVMKKLGIICCDFNKGIVGTDREGKVNLVFEMSQPLDIEVYLYSTDMSISAKFLELCILKRVVHNFLIVIIYPPHPGLYGLDLHGAPKGTFNSLLHSQLPPIGKYLIKSHHQVRSFTQFPKGDNRDWGPKQRFYDLGLHTVANIDPFIINEDGKQIEIEIAMLKPVTIWYKFDYDINGTTKPIDNYCFMNYKINSSKRSKTVSFLLRFPFRGFYHLAIMATEVYPSRPDEIVYNYLIRVQDPSSDVERFPIIMNPILWRECSLITPKNYRLNSYDVHFSVIVPNTNRVQVCSDESAIDRLEPKEIENSWVGLVGLHEDTTFIYIEAEFEGKMHKLIRFKGPSYYNKDGI